MLNMSAPTAKKDPKFYSELKQTNEDIINFLKLNMEKSPYWDFTPTFKSYIKQIEDMSYMKKTEEISFLKQTTETTETKTNPPPFTFGSSSSIFPVSTPLFSFAKKEDESSFNNDTKLVNDEEDAPPPEPNVEKYEEPNAKYSIKSKLYEKCKSSDGKINVNLLGIGMLYVKSLQDNKLQVIFRQEPDLRRVLLNDIVTTGVPVKLLPKAVQIVFPSVTGESKFYIAKVKDERDADCLFENLKL